MADSRYHEYLRSAGWKDKVAEVRKRSMGACERCALGSDHDHTHHLTYKHKYREVITDDPWDGINELVGVCASCHAFLHGLTDLDPVKYGSNWMKFMRDGFDSKPWKFHR